MFSQTLIASGPTRSAMSVYLVRGCIQLHCSPALAPQSRFLLLSTARRPFSPLSLHFLLHPSPSE